MNIHKLKRNLSSHEHALSYWQARAEAYLREGKVVPDSIRENIAHQSKLVSEYVDDLFELELLSVDDSNSN